MNPRASRLRVPLTLKRLREVLSYDPVTGIFQWLKKRGRSSAGYVAGRTISRGYVVIEVDGIPYRAHRLAWFYMRGRWPKYRIDHRDLNKSNNAWSNIREATNGQNAANTTLRSTNKSGYKGVSFDSKKHKWLSGLTKDGRFHFLGRYDSKEAAAAAYASAALDKFGEFARTS